MLRWLLSAGALFTLAGCQACVDLQQERAYPCSRDAGSDALQCPENWTCGLEGVCHSGTEPAPYLCKTDEDCVGVGWRCGPEAHCVDAKLDSLQATPASAQYKVSRLSPAVLESQPELLAVSDDFQFTDTCSGSSSQTVGFSWIADGGLTKVVMTRYPVVIAADGGVAADGGTLCNASETYDLPAKDVDLLFQAQAALPGPAVAIAELGNQTLVALANGAVCNYRWSVSAPLVTNCAPDFFGAGFAPKQLRMSRNGQQVVAFNDQSLAILDVRSGSKTAPRSILGANGQPVQLKDVLLVGESPGYVYAATSRGLYVAQYQGGAIAPYGSGTVSQPFVPAQVSESECDSSNARFDSLIVSLETAVDESALLATREESGRGISFSLITRVPSAGMGACTNLPAPAGLFFSTGNAFGSNSDCQAGSLVSGHIVSSSRPTETLTVRVEARCSELNGRQPVLRYAFSGKPENPPAPLGQDSFSRVSPRFAPQYTRATLSERANPRRHAQMDGLGHLWWTHDDFEAPLALFLDRVPLAVLGGPDNWIFRVPSVLAGLGAENNTVVVKDSTFVGWPGGRLVPVDKGDVQFPILSNVQGEPRWAVMELFAESSLPPFVGDFGSRLVPLPQTIGARFPGRLDAPNRAMVATRGDGTRLLIHSAFDAIYVVQPQMVGIDDANAFNDLPEAVVRLVPLPRGTITSLVAIPPKPGAAPTSVVGYALAASRLFRFETRSATVWQADEVLLPPGDPVKIFADGKWGRLGFADGRVFGLTSRAQLAPPLPSNAGKAADFVQACAQIFALASDGVYRLAANDGDTEGNWVRVPVDDAWLAAGDSRLEDGLLHASGGQLLVISPNGRAVTVSELGCAQ